MSVNNMDELKRENLCLHQQIAKLTSELAEAEKALKWHKVELAKQKPYIKDLEAQEKKERKIREQVPAV